MNNSKFPYKSLSKSKGQSGQSFFQHFIINELGWLYHKVEEENDYGIDAYIEVVDNGSVTGRLIGVQIKHGDSYFKVVNHCSIVFHGEEKHLNYYMNSTTPILIILLNTNFSNICHIEDAEEGGRYNPNMTDKQRASFDNLILLCANHHIETNDKEKYTVPILQKMKREHESNYLNQKIKSNPSMLKNTINAIANINLDEIQESVSLEVIDPSEKIKYNSI